MAKRWLILLSLLFPLALAASLAPGPQAQEEGHGPAPTGLLGTARVWRGLAVPPTPALDSGRLISIDILDTKGYPALVVTLTGQSKGSVPQPGRVGVILVPEDERCLRALEREGQYLGALHVLADLTPGKGQPLTYFSSASERLQVGFPRYRVLLYNTTNHTAEVDLHTYLTW